MGIDWHTARLLVGARGEGVNFERTATLGRQNLYVSNRQLSEFFRENRFESLAKAALDSPKQEYADDFIRLLGAEVYTPIDASPYEGAAEVHDMNTPVPDRLRSSFDVVIDGGTLEHVFHFPTSIKNCMEMVRVGGHLFLQTPANNFFGHGFYQFSPELFYRVFSSENGYTVERMLAYEAYSGSPWYEVADPARVGRRVELVNTRHRVLLLVHARRLEERPIFAAPPQQSDYSATWAKAAMAGGDQVATAPRLPEPGIVRKLLWVLCRQFGAPGRRAYAERRARFFNDQLSLDGQPEVFQPADR